MRAALPEDHGVPTLNALSFDIEDWFHIVEVDGVDDPATWEKLSERATIVERYTDRILRICADHDTRATFFVLGWIADRHPSLVRRIMNDGHEIGSHSFWHRRVYQLTPEMFRADVQASLSAIQSASEGRLEIRGFRAPSFSIVPGTEWAFDVLLELGFHYDASLFPASRGHGGYACPPGPHLVRTPLGRTIRELPMSISPIGLGQLRKRMCYSGGGYFRVLPLWAIDQGIQVAAGEGRPTVLYLHPRDFAPDAPRVRMPIHRWFKCYVGTHTTESKLRSLLARYRWGTCESVLAHEVS
jgi:peptidoglycan-N-acetylglucosamine deacetylase